MSLRTRLIISTLLIIFLIIAGSYLVIQDIQTGIIEGEFRDMGFLLANHLALEITTPLLVNDITELRNAVENTKSGNPDIEYIFVTDAKGIVLYDTFEKGFPAALLNRSRPSHVDTEYVFNTDSGIVHEFDAPLFNNVGYVHIGVSENKINAQILEASRKLLILAASAIILGGLAAYFIGRRLTEPIIKLTEGANRINKGVFDQKIDISAGDELGELAKTFNNMASSLNQKIKELVSSKEEIVARNKELTVLNEISKNIGETFDLNKILVHSYESLLKLTNMEKGEIYLFDETSGKFKIYLGEKEEDNPQSREVLIVEGGKDDVSFVSIPLKSKDKVLGVITLRSSKLHKFSDSDRELFNSIGNQIGVAIENIAFYENIKYLKEFNEEILNNVNLAIHVVDRNMNILAVNNELIKFGRGRFKKEQIMNKNLFEAFPILKEKYVDKEYEHVLKTGEIFQSEEKTEYYDEIVYTSTSKIPIKNKNGEVEKIITVIKDISEQKQLEEQLKDSYDELKLTYSKLQELYRIKDNFLSNVSHELRTPLTSIMGFAELLIEENVTKEQKHKLEIIMRNSKRLHGLIKSLLDTTLIESKNLQLNFQTLPVYEIASQVAEDMGTFASLKNLPIRIEIPRNLIVKGDRERLMQVFSNIVDNAIKFTISGEIRIRAENEDEHVHIKISDTGIGIPEDKLERIFDRLYQIDASKTRRYGGAGLGMWISKNIVEAHGGKIWAESKNRGSTFHILLPRPVKE